MLTPYQYLEKHLGHYSAGYKKLIVKTYSIVLPLIFTKAIGNFSKGLWFTLIRNHEKKHREFLAGSKIWGESVIKIAKAKIHISNELNIPRQGHIVLINHVNELDFAFDSYIVSLPYLANQQIKSSVFAYWWMRAMGSQVFDTSHARTISYSIRNLVEGLKIHSYIVYPEGHNSYCEEIKPLKKGMLKVAYESKIPMVILLKSGNAKLQDSQDNIVIGYRNGGLIHPENYKSAEEMKEAIFLQMTSEKKILDLETEQKIKELS